MATIASAISGYVDVRVNCSAKGDASSDDTAAFQRAVDLGGSIFVPPGTYMIDEVSVSKECHILLDPRATLKQRSASNSDIALIRFTSGADNSSLEGGMIDGNSSVLSSSYTGSIESNLRTWCGIRIDSAISHVTVRRTRIYNFVSAGFWHQNGRYVTWEDVYVRACGKGFICQSSDYGALRRVVCEDIDNNGKAIYQHAVEIRDATGLTIDGLSVVDFQPDNAGLEPTPTAIAFERCYGLSAKGLLATGFSGSGKPPMGFVFDTLTDSSVVGWHVRDGYEQGATVNSCSDTTFDAFTLKFDRLTPLSGDGIGLRVRGGGLYPAIGDGTTSENARSNDGCRNTRFSNGYVIGAGSIGYVCQSGQVTFDGCEAVGCVDHGFHVNENLANSLFDGATAPKAEHVRLDDCSARYNGQMGLLVEDGRHVTINGGDYSNNGQDSAKAAALRSGVRFLSGDAFSVFDALCEDTQDWTTKTNGASFKPGTTDTDDRYEISLRDPDQINVGQYITLTDAGGSGTDATALVVAKNLDDVTVEVAGGFTFSSSSNLTNLTGTFSSSGVTLTGSGSALDTEVPGRTWVTDGTEYRRIIRVNSATSAILEAAFTTELSGATIQVLTVDVDPIASQQYGVYVDSDSTNVVGRVHGASNETLLWGVESAASLLRIDSAGNEWPSIASAATLTVPHDVHTANITGTTGITSISASYPGKRLHLKFAASLTVTDGSNLKLAGDFTATADDVLSLVCDGTNWYQAGSGTN